MSNALRIHLIFSEVPKKMFEDISRVCHVTGWDTTLEAASIWAKSGDGDDPNLFIINTYPYFIETGKLYKTAPIKLLLENLIIIKKYRSKSRVILLLPNKALEDEGFVLQLLKIQIYDFWFVECFDGNDIEIFIKTRRTRTEAEEYIKIKEVEFIKEKAAANKSPIESYYRPYYVKPNIIAFWSADNSLLNHGLALLTALKLAESGFKVALVEAITPFPHLASSLSLRHPYYNTSHAVSLYYQGNKEFLKKCLYNFKGYSGDKNSLDIYDNMKIINNNLYLLPDGKRADNISKKDMETVWNDFATALAKSVVFENDFNFLIFECFGVNAFSEFILHELAYMQYYTVNMLPSSLMASFNQRAQINKKIMILGNTYLKDLTREIKELEEYPLMYFPDCFEKDFLKFVYSGKKTNVSESTEQLINRVIREMGLKLVEQKSKRWTYSGWKSVKNHLTKLGG